MRVSTLLVMVLAAVALAQPQRRGDDGQDSAAPETPPSHPGRVHACCRALTATCLACAAGLSVDEWCAQLGNDSMCESVASRA